MKRKPKTHLGLPNRLGNRRKGSHRAACGAHVPSNRILHTRGDIISCKPCCVRIYGLRHIPS